MTVAKKIEAQLQNIPEGTPFRYEDLLIESSEYEAAAKSIGRFVNAGTLKRATKGVFYKPKQTIFGTVAPTDDALIRQYLFKNGRRVAYVTGASLYNQMGLTTQVPFTIVVATKTRRSEVVIGKVKIKPIRSYADVTNENYKLLEILDALKDFKIIPDINRMSAITILKNKIQELSTDQIRNLIECALNYPPRTKALLGAILEIGANNSLDLTTLRKSFSPLSRYDMGITTNILPNAAKWNLI